MIFEEEGGKHMSLSKVPAASLGTCPLPNWLQLSILLLLLRLNTSISNWPLRHGLELHHRCHGHRPVHLLSGHLKFRRGSDEQGETCCTSAGDRQTACIARLAARRTPSNRQYH
ncbi:hypothetical protein BgiMline_027847 [Biomphalaria glabrata]|nr:hypothetical protein BgiMline_013704 [Biomphalaria glabrata]